MVGGGGGVWGNSQTEQAEQTEPAEQKPLKK